MEMTPREIAIACGKSTQGIGRTLIAELAADYLRLAGEVESKDASLLNWDTVYLKPLRERISSLEAALAMARSIVASLEHGFDCESKVRLSECAGYGKCDCGIARALAALEGK